MKKHIWAVVVLLVALIIITLFAFPEGQVAGPNREQAAGLTYASFRASFLNFWRGANPSGLESEPPPPPDDDGGDPCPKGFKKCGDWCCNKKTQTCERTVPIFGTKYCKKKKNFCRDDQKLCPADNAPTCCDKSDSCGIKTVSGVFQAAVCVPPPPDGGCNENSPTYCGSIDGGTKVCCGKNQECIKPAGLPVCQPTSCPPGQTLCQGKVGYGGEMFDVKICCAGSCFKDPNGSPNCNPSPPKPAPPGGGG